MKPVDEAPADDEIFVGPTRIGKTAVALKALPPLRKGHLREIPIDEIEPNPDQPRKEFDPVAMAELTESIQQIGLLQPIAVRELDKGERNDTAKYQIILGERRWRASRAAGVLNIEAKVYAEVTPGEAKILALVENLQRADMNPIEEAAGFKAILDEGYTQEQISKIVGRSRPVVANALRVLELPLPVIDLIRDKHLTMAHGVAIARFKAWPRVAEELAARAHERGITASELEDEKLPCAQHLVNAGLAVRIKLAWGEKLPAELKKNPAYFGDEYTEKFCIEPEHWKAEQKKIAAAKKTAEEKARQDAIDAEEKARKGKKIKLDELDRNSYAEMGVLGDFKGLSKLVPDEKLATAKDDEGKDVKICTDKKFVEDLKKHADDILKQDRAAKLPGLISKAREKIKAIKKIGPRELAFLILAGRNYDCTDIMFGDDISDASVKRMGVKLPKELGECFGFGQIATEQLEIINNIDQVALVKVWFDMILEWLEEGVRDGQFTVQDSAILRWFLEVDELGLLDETDEGRKALVELVKGKLTQPAKVEPAETTKKKKGGKVA